MHTQVTCTQGQTLAHTALENSLKNSGDDYKGSKDSVKVPDWSSGLQTGQNVGKWAVPFANGPICRRDASPDGPEHMQTSKTKIRVISQMLITKVIEHGQ